MFDLSEFDFFYGNGKSDYSEKFSFPFFFERLFVVVISFDLSEFDFSTMTETRIILTSFVPSFSYVRIYHCGMLVSTWNSSQLLS